MRRVAIIGNGGGGKSILARELARALTLPVHAVDDVQWQPGWVRTPLDDIARTHARWLAEPGWIIDGWGSWESLAERFAMADAIVLVDFPLRTHYWWAIKRQVECTLGLRRDWPPKGCKVLPITWRLLQVIRRVHYEYRPRLIALLAEPHIRDRVVHLRSPRELRQFRDRMVESAGA
jgi:adenylate kinase family enzyme